jgi:hypothetical protein
MGRRPITAIALALPALMGCAGPQPAPPRRSLPKAFVLRVARVDGYNFEQQPFTTAPHACGVAFVGSQGRVDGAVIGNAGRFVVTAAGPLRVGINDRDPGNNRGWVAFEGETRAPTPGEWNSGLSEAP